MYEEGSLPKGKPMSECPNGITVLVHHKSLEPYYFVGHFTKWDWRTEGPFNPAQQKWVFELNPGECFSDIENCIEFWLLPKPENKDTHYA